MINNEINEDAYWEHIREQRESEDKVITTCDCCGEDITVSYAFTDGYYVIDGVELCYDCLRDYFQNNLRYE